MERQGDEVHVSTREARAGGGPRSMRTVLLGGIALVVLAFAVIGLVNRAKLPTVLDTATPAASAAGRHRLT